jgi:hypothetical protein
MMMPDQIKITAVLRDTRTGEVREHHYLDEAGADQEDTIHGVLWVWTEGNYECDCNRSIFMYGVDKQMPCNSDDNVIVLDDLIIDGASYKARLADYE